MKNKKSIKRILDVGASDCYVLKEFKALYPTVEVIGVEPNAGHRNWAVYVDGIPCVSKLEKVKGKFDLIILYHQLEHVQKPDEFMKIIKDYLTEDGLIYLALPTLSRIEYSNIGQMFKDEHINHFSDDTLIYFLNKLGFEELFVDKSLYGTCVIAKQNDEMLELIDKNFFADTKILLNRISQCFELKKQMEDAMRYGKTGEAKGFGKKALSIFDNYTELIAKFASLHDTIDEQDILIDYINKKPDLKDLNMQLAMAYYKEKDFTEAKVYLDRAEKLMGPNGTIYAHKAYIAYHEEDLGKAVEFVKLAIEREPYTLSNISLLASLVTKL